MAVLLPLWLLFFLYTTSNGVTLPFVRSTSIDRGMPSGVMMEMLRAMANQTKGDTLTLPANATSIRPNITDNFSCANRTYGYYADVENECQIFHVCVPSQTPSGRNTTYKYSFICNNETIFNQEVMTCTRPRDSIDCEDSPMYYDKNDEFGKVNNTDAEDQAENNTNLQGQTQNTNNPVRSNINKNKNKRKNTVNRNQNIVLQNTGKDAMENNMNKPIAAGTKFNKYVVRNNEIMDMNKEEVVKPVVEIGEGEMGLVNEMVNVEIPMEREIDMMQNERLVAERSVRRKERRLNKRGSFRFKADVVD